MDIIKYISRQEFLQKAAEMNFEVYTENQVRSFQEDVVKSIDSEERRLGAIDFASLNREIVVNDDLSKSVLFWRPSQIEFKEEIDEVTLLKSKTGYYKDTPENRAKGIVGKSYGDQKAEDRENMPKVSANLSKMKADYISAKKKGDKKAVGLIIAQIKAYEDKMKSKEKEDKSKDKGKEAPSIKKEG